MRNGKLNPKNYPYWEPVLKILKEKGYFTIQIGRTHEKPLENVDLRCLWSPSFESIIKLAQESLCWISIDNFLPHLLCQIKISGIVIFAQSDPLIFGYPQNINLLKDRKYLREKQFWLWEQSEYNIEAFIEPNIVIQAVGKFCN